MADIGSGVLQAAEIKNLAARYEASIDATTRGQSHSNAVK